MRLQKLTRWLWREKVHTDSHKYEMIPAPFNGCTDDKSYLRHIGLKYAIQTDCLLIEPVWGWGLRPYFRLIAESHPYWINAEHGWPPYPSISQYLNPFKRIREIPEAISIHYGWDNYYHFHIDTVPVLLESLISTYKDIPILAPSAILDIDYVQSFLKSTRLFDQREVIYQDSDEYIKITRKAIFLKMDRSDPFTLRNLIWNSNGPIQDLSSTPHKIFIVRRNNRTATNLDELLNIAEAFGYFIVDPGEHDYEYQISLFSYAKLIIGFHGAGLTNIIFSREKRCKVLELFPADRVPGQYWLLARQLGFVHDYLLGSFLDQSGNFYVDPAEFINSIKMIEVR